MSPRNRMALKMPRWTTQEEIVLLYYASRRIKNPTIMEILSIKCNPKVRTLKQIGHKLARLRKAYGQEETIPVGTRPMTDRAWNRGLVDQWLFSKMDKAHLGQLLEFDGEIASIIGELNDLDDFVGIMNLDDAVTIDQPNRLNHADQPEESSSNSSTPTTMTIDDDADESEEPSSNSSTPTTMTIDDDADQSEESSSNCSTPATMTIEDGADESEGSIHFRDKW